jgi:hypothetical protein
MTTPAPATEIVRVTPASEYNGLTMVVSPAEALRRIQEMQAFIKEVMVPGVDYGVIPGTGGKNPKPSLLQPGAQKLAELYGFAHTFGDIETIEDWDKPLFFFRKRCVLTLRKDGRFIGDGIGSCNSKEDRYAWRWCWESELPAAFDKKTLKVRTLDTKRGASKQYRVPNDDIFSLVNTVEKMACKRSLIHAVLSATRSAGIFTQDMEDLPEDAFGEADEARSWESESAKNERDEIAGALEKAVMEVKARKDLTAVAARIKAAKITDAQRDALRGLWAKAKAAIEKTDKEPNGDSKEHDEPQSQNQREPGED